MTTHDPWTVVFRMFLDGMVRGDINAAMDAYAPDFAYHNPIVDESPGLTPGVDAMRTLLVGSRVAFPDMRCLIETAVAEGDRVALRYSWAGTHTGVLEGFPATGRRVSGTGAMFCRVREGKIIEQWDLVDRLGMMQQLGVELNVPQLA